MVYLLISVVISSLLADFFFLAGGDLVDFFVTQSLSAKILSLFSNFWVLLDLRMTIFSGIWVLSTLGFVGKSLVFTSGCGTSTRTLFLYSLKTGGCVGGGLIFKA